MGITVFFWGQLVEITQKELITVDTIPKKLTHLCDELNITFPGLIGKTYAISVNKKFVINMELELKSGDEIAFMPPFAGG